MINQLLHMKLYIPVTRGNLVPRPAMMTRLDEGLNGRLTLVSAPAGFGKTTLISEWLAASERPTAWLSLDEEDSDPLRFLAYLITALQRVGPEIGKSILANLQSGQPPIQMVLTTLLNEIAVFPEPFILVLDDYHVVNAQAVNQVLAFLLEHLPPQMHLVITTREDPNLPLARLRVRRQLNELRAGDLRFTKAEAAQFLNQIMSLALSEEDIATLEARTEGWIAGLQLAALSMQRRADVQGFIKAFAGDDRYIVDYLVDEVLQSQPEKVRRFLLQTAILERLSGPLCDAVTRQAGGSELLESLERTNLFVVPLDDKRQWCRYHHLFAGVLRVHLMKEYAEEIPVLHRRASAWYEKSGGTAGAVRHALAAKDYEKAADLIELAWPEMDRNRQSRIWLGWARALPEAVFDYRPVLNLSYGWVLLSTGELEAGKARLHEAERWLKRSEKMIVVDEEHFASLPVSLATAQAYHAQAVGNVADTLKYARLALELVPEDDLQGRGRPASLLAMAHWSNGELAAAADYLAGSMKETQMGGNLGFTITGTYVLTEICRGLGRLQEAVSYCKQSLELAAEHSEVIYRGTADVHVGLGAVYLEQGKLEAAERHLLKSEELDDRAASPYCGYRLGRAKARLKEIEGEFNEALRLLDEAEARYMRGPAPEARSVGALKARIWLAQGRLADVWGWVAEQGLSVEDALSYLREFEHLTLARLLLADYKRTRQEANMLGAMELLTRLLETAEASERRGSILEILIQQAVAYEAQNKVSAALLSLGRAVALAEPEGYVRLFLDEGQPMAGLLKKMKGDKMGGSRGEVEARKAYVRQLLVAFEGPGAVRPSVVSSQPLVEPLSERELEVLQLVAEGLTNRQIAERLYLALPTVKGHNRIIYSKLQVGRRTEAVARARELGIL